jgi:hypothetical protein
MEPVNEEASHHERSAHDVRNPAGLARRRPAGGGAGSDHTRRDTTNSRAAVKAGVFAEEVAKRTQGR